jgi:oligoendopeptidase F
VGKAPGSYAGAIYGSLPFVFLSYRERLADVYTLTHELGHALHTSFAQKQQPFVYANLSTPGGFLAEVASNVHEMLLTQYLLKTAIEKQTRLAALGRVLDAYQTAFFVPMLYAQFEYAMYHAAEAGQALTAEYLNSTFMESMKRQYGTEIVLDEVSAVRWSFSAHLYESFYSFQYATGVAIAASLVQQMLREGEPSINRYHDFLRSGKSGDSLHLLEDAGVDMLTPEPIKQAITLFESYLEEMESLV